MCYRVTCILQKPWLSFTRAQHTCVQAEHGQVLHSLHQGSQAPEVTGIAWGLIGYAWVGPARYVSVSRDPWLPHTAPEDTPGQASQPHTFFLHGVHERQRPSWRWGSIRDPNAATLSSQASPLPSCSIQDSLDPGGSHLLEAGGGQQPPEEPAPHRTSRLHEGRFSSHHFLFNQPAPCWLECPSGGRCLQCPFRSQHIWEEPESVTGHRHCSLLEAKLLKM